MTVQDIKLLIIAPFASITYSDCCDDHVIVVIYIQMMIVLGFLKCINTASTLDSAISNELDKISKIAAIMRAAQLLCYTSTVVHLLSLNFDFLGSGTVNGVEIIFDYCSNVILLFKHMWVISTTEWV